MPKLHPSHDSAKCKICNQVPQSINKLINCINIFSELTLSIIYITGIDIKKNKNFIFPAARKLWWPPLQHSIIKYYSPYFWIGQCTQNCTDIQEKKVIILFYLFIFCFVCLLFCICDLFTKSSTLWCLI